MCVSIDGPIIKANAPGQARRADDVRLSTEALSRRCLQPVCSTACSHNLKSLWHDRHRPAVAADPAKTHRVNHRCLPSTRTKSATRSGSFGVERIPPSIKRCLLRSKARKPSNDPSSATRPAGGVACNQSAMAGRHRHANPGMTFESKLTQNAHHVMMHNRRSRFRKNKEKKSRTANDARCRKIHQRGTYTPPPTMNCS